MAGIAIAVPIVALIPDIPSVIGGLIGGIGVYPLVAKITGHYKSGRLTEKGIGGSVRHDTAGTTNHTDTPDSPDGSAAIAKTEDSDKNSDSMMDR